MLPGTPRKGEFVPVNSVVFKTFDRTLARKLKSVIAV